MPLRLEAQVGPSAVHDLWCAIYQVAGKHATNNCHLLQKYLQMPQQLFCNFFKLVDHDKKNCQSYDLMMERTANAYRLQA